MKFRDFFQDLDAEAQKRYAQRAGTTAKYIYTHYMSQPPRKIPRRELMHSLVDASDGAVSLDELLEHFYLPPEMPPPKAEAE